MRRSIQLVIFTTGLAAAGEIAGSSPQTTAPSPQPPVQAPAAQAPPVPQGTIPERPSPLIPGARAIRSCESLTALDRPDTVIESAAIEEGRGGLVCRVTAAVVHPADRIRIWVGLPMQDWNGRLLGTGGAGYAGGSPNSIAQPAALGYVAAATDTGHAGGSGSFALDSRGRLNWHAIRDNALVGIHEMTEVAKALTAALYGTAPRYSYFMGCSSGGRQGLMEAQRFPDDYDGILSVAPAANWGKFLPADTWPQVVMTEARHFVPVCKSDAATEAAVQACDGMDGVRDGVLDDPRRCAFDPKALAGAEIDGCGTFTEADADVIRRMWEGPRRLDGSWMWYGIPRGAPLSPLGGTGGTPLTGRPFRIALEWLRYFLLQDPEWDWTTISRARFEELFDQSFEQYDAVLGTADPDLTRFRQSNGKLIMWHGWADELIPAEGSIDYLDRVRARMGGGRNTDGFIRLFMAPGVGHCAGGPGPHPGWQIGQLQRWVEDGKAPGTLMTIRRDEAGQVVRSRPLCPYPAVARYKGRGSTDAAGSFECQAPSGGPTR